MVPATSFCLLMSNASFFLISMSLVSCFSFCLPEDWCMKSNMQIRCMHFVEGKHGIWENCKGGVERVKEDAQLATN